MSLGSVLICKYLSVSKKQQINQTKWDLMRVIMLKIMKTFLGVISIYFDLTFLFREKLQYEK